MRYEKKFADCGKQISILYNRDLAEEIWADRPAFPAGAVNVIEECLAGCSVEDKLRAVREKLLQQGAQSLLLTKLDDLMWLFNIRGCDVECNPVAMSYGYITQETAVLFLQKKVIGEDLQKYFAEHHIFVENYENIESYLKGLSEGQRILVDMRYCSYAFYQILAERHTLIEAQNPTELLKAVKNPTELANMREIYLKDSVALTKFIYWLKTAFAGGGETITEVDAADKLEQYRREIPEFLDLSFPTIAAYGANAAMMHYEATPEHCAVLKPEGLFLVDSGGQYLGGTTDVTRTIALGAVSEEQKLHYTMVLSAMLQLTRARWLYGCTGRNLDILARQPIWDMGLDYKCGTGHGVGYILNVHEGPQNMRWRFAQGQAEPVLEEGMDITNEPGIYIEGSHGIRIENVMVVRKGVKNEYGQFMHFETLTWVPIDMNAVNTDALTAENLAALRQYQNEVYERISPYMDEEERAWLWKETHRL
jgi:Xaa-Pro aminopeptidase